MNKIITFLLVLLFFTNNIGASSKLPKWVQDVAGDCKDGNICAVGSGKSLNTAKADARNNIQKVFETKISSSFSTDIKNKNDNINEYYSDSLQENSEGILKGIVISKTFKDGEGFYVLASLDKENMAKEVKIDIENSDKQMKVLLNDNKTYLIKKLEYVYNNRNLLNKKYLFLTGKSIPEVVKYKDINKYKQKARENSKSYFLAIDNLEIKNLIENLLNDNGIKIAKAKENAQRVISGKITTKKEFLDVDDFEKYSISLTLNVLNDNIIISSLNRKIVETGMSFEQIYEKLMVQLSDFITDNFINIIE
jgi:hypothetical protein